MDLITGGLYQGQEEYIKENYESCLDLLESVRGLLSEGKNEDEIIECVLDKNSDAVLAIEIGAGLIPVDSFERNLREVYGRCSCEVAKKADRVIKFTCGIKTYIK